VTQEDIVGDIWAVIPNLFGSFFVGVAEQPERRDFRDSRQELVTFAAREPWDFVAFLMARFSGAEAAIELFDPASAGDMRHAAEDFFPLQIGTESLGDQYFSRGMVCWQRERVAESAAAFGEAALRYRSHEPSLLGYAYLWRGYALAALARRASAGNQPPTDPTREARQAFAAAIKAKPSCLRLVFSAVNALLLLGDAESLDVVSDALRRWCVGQPNSVGAHRGLGLVLALSAQLENHYELAYEEFTESIRLDPGNVASLRSRAFVQLQRQNYASALSDANEAIARSPADAAAHYYKAVALYALRDTQAALDAVEAALEASTPADQRGSFEYLRAVALGDLAQYSNALEALKSSAEAAQQTLDGEPDQELVCRVEAARGLYLAQLGHHYEGRAACESAINRVPAPPPEVYATLAWILHVLGHLPEADEMIRRAVTGLDQAQATLAALPNRGARWPILLCQASILNSLAERSGDEYYATAAIVATTAAEWDFQTVRDTASPAERERASQLFLERAYALSRCERTAEIASALRSCRELAPEDSRPWMAADRALQQQAANVRPIPVAWIIGAVPALLAGGLALLLFGVLSSVAFVALSLGLIGFGFAAYLLPSLTALKVTGAFEIQRTIKSERLQLTRICDPPPPVPDTSRLLKPRLRGGVDLGTISRHLWILSTPPPEL
jgi:tetratricopeptide (TPR) repeat protein